jgi:nuclear pore complex protein Nup98-Nup96
MLLNLNKGGSGHLRHSYCSISKPSKGKYLYFLPESCANSRREKSIRALLHRYPTPTSDEITFLTNRLQIPVQWIHESKAASLASSGDAWGEYHSLLKAELWARAHRILIDKLAPEAVLRGDLGLLGRLCEGLVGKVDGWEYGGQLFIDYIDSTTEIPTLLKEAITSGQISARLTHLANDLPRLLRLLPALFPTDGVQQVACLSDMLSALHHLAGQLSLANLVSRPAVPDTMVDVDRLHLLQSSAFDAFSTALEGVIA